ncbi:MAG TPA: DUF4350 domain-containing protein [Thermoanaerobaculia bacterium]|nr:DUF4350 domain-containing protein [Thermoanaerobaculia bacterium]
MRRLRIQRNHLLIAAGVAAVLGIGITLLSGGQDEARGSVLSRGPGGWLAARRYLEARGVHVHLLDQPLDQFTDGGVLVTAFPWQQVGTLGNGGEPLEEHLRRGGSLILAWSGDRTSPAEILVLEGLGLSLREARKAPLSPLRWRRFAREEWDLRPGPGVAGSGEPVRIWAPRWAPAAPQGEQALLQGPDGKGMVESLTRQRGTIWLVPADAFANARLGNPGNAGLLETLRQRLGDDWTFDEYHHGFAGRQPVETAALGRTLDLVLLHLALLYLAALLTLARPFGPAWSEPPVVAGSVGTFLLGLGAVHHRLGHHREAARRLLARVRELDRNLDLPAALDGEAESAGARGLVALAREVARRRRGLPPEKERETEG